MDLFLEVRVLALEPALEGGDLLVRHHVLDGEPDLVGGVLQEGDVRLVVLLGSRAGHRERADGAAARRHGDDDVGAHAVLERLLLGGVRAFPGEVAPEQWPLLLEHLPDVAFVGGDLEADTEVPRGERGLQHEQTQHLPRGVVEEDRRAVEGHGLPDGARDGGEEGVSREARDDGVVDLEQGAIALAGIAGRIGGHGRQGAHGTRAPRELRSYPGFY
jgi:hypothetical protein